jgi:hypothetical protein
MASKNEIESSLNTNPDTNPKKEKQDLTIPPLPSPSPESNEFKGKYGPLLDEIKIKQFQEKYKGSPVFNGAFKNV